MNTEQERAEFEAWCKQNEYDYVQRLDGTGYNNEATKRAWKAWQARAALQSQPNRAGWKEAAIAWEVCASLHRKYCKGKDPLFKTRQADFVRHADDARKRFSEPDALQTQPQAEPSEWLKQHEALMHRVSKAAMVVGYGGTINGATAEQSLENAEKRLLDHARSLQSQDREDAERWRYWKKWLESDESDGHQYPPEVDLIWHKRPDLTFDEAIDHARRIEGGRE